MQILNKDEVKIQKEELVEKIKQGDVFIHPTDTIYGIGCDATNDKAVKRIRDAKERITRPFSVIAPSKQWIIDNCEFMDGKEWLDKLPGPYTLILKLKNKKAVSSKVNNNLNTIGVRMPAHWFMNVVMALGKPVVTTSANVMGENYMTTIENLNSKIKAKMDFAIYEGEKHGKPSTIIDMTKKKPEIKER